MTVAEASSQSAFLIEEDTTDRLWQAWLAERPVRMQDPKGKAAISFEQFKKETLTAAKKTATKAPARALRDGEEAARLDFAAQFVKFEKGVPRG